MPQTITPQSIAHWRQMKNDVVDEDAQQVRDTVGLLDQILLKFPEIHATCQPLPPRHDSVWLSFMLLGCHRMLLNAADMLLARQRPEAFAHLRAVIELAVAAHKIGQKPELVKVWLNREHYDKDAFTSKWTKGDKLTEPLRKAWELTSNNGSHGNVNAFLLNLETHNKTEVRSYYVMQDAEDQRRTLIYMTEMCARVLDVFVAAMKPMAKVNLEAKVVILKSAIEVHKLNYKWLFEKGIKVAKANAQKTAPKTKAKVTT